ncbi:MAG: hypothetical protein TYPL_0130 [Candidatus Tyloplasma litorale]|nr:MAG: hypothetical protein TYPL_0130 [Mycoplasmatales bacterium]
MHTLNCFYKNIIFNFRMFLKNRSLILSIPLFISIGMLFPLFFVPVRKAIALTFLSIWIPLNGIYFYYINVQFRRTSLYGNYRITRNSKKIFYSSALFSILTLTIFATIILFMILWMFGYFNLLLIDPLSYPLGPNGQGSVKYLFNLNLLAVILYCGVETSILIFIISLIFEFSVNNDQIYFVFLFMSMLLILMFGGSLNDYFYVNGNKMSLDKENSWYPPEFYIPSILFPFFSIGQVVNSSFELSQQTLNSEGVYEMSEWWNYNDSLFNLVEGFNNDFSWKLAIVIPYFEMAGMIIIIPLISRDNSSN